MKRLGLILCVVVALTLLTTPAYATSADAVASVDAPECEVLEAVPQADVEPDFEASLFETLEPAAETMPGACQDGCDTCYHDWECGEGGTCGSPWECINSVE